MLYTVRNQKILSARLALFALLISLTSCSKPENAALEKDDTQKTFASPADAGEAFVNAANSGNPGALLAIFGPDAKEVLFTGDAVKDKKILQDLAAAYNQMHRWREIKVGGQILYL